MVHYFSYGSNMSLTSLRAKGVEPRASERARLAGYALAFDVHHWFRDQGGVGNIHPSDAPEAQVLGIVHECNEDDLGRLDVLESRGVGYERSEVTVETVRGSVSAVCYVGLPAYLDPSCLPTARYLNILVQGAEAAGLEPAYIESLRRQPIHTPREYPQFSHPPSEGAAFDRATLAREPLYTALAGAVFDMTDCHWKLDCVKELFGGKDMTLFHLQRLDCSDGSETLADVAAGRISVAGRKYLNAYLYAYAAEYRYVGRYVYDRPASTDTSGGDEQ